MWGQDIRVAIIPLFLAVTYLGQSVQSESILNFLDDFQLYPPPATWLTAISSIVVVQDQTTQTNWGFKVVETSLAASMAVNTLVTGLIAFKILKVFLEVKNSTTSVERSLGSSGVAKLHHIVFIIIESGMALFVIQLIRLLLDSVPSVQSTNAVYMIIGIHEMFNVIIKSVLIS